MCHVVLQYPTLSHGAHAARFTQWQSSTNVDLAFETILIEIYRIVTRKTLEAGGDGPRPEAGTKIVLNQPGGQGAGKKKGGCC